MDYIKEKLFRQLAVGYCCSVSDIKDNKNHFTEYKTLEGRRQFEKVDDDSKRWSQSSFFQAKNGWRMASIISRAAR